MKNLFILFLVLIASQLAAQTTYLHCGQLFDATSKELQAKMTIVVEGNRITNVAQGYLRAEDSITVIDLKDQTVMPGHD